MTEIESVRSGHVVIGVDTHKHIHVAVVMDSIGAIFVNLTIAADGAGFTWLLEWASSSGKIIAFGIEGTGSYGAGLTSFVRRHGHKAIEVCRPIQTPSSPEWEVGHPRRLRTPPEPFSLASPPRLPRLRMGPWR
jgi:Transposase